MEIILNFLGPWKAPVYFILLMALAIPLIGIAEGDLKSKRLKWIRRIVILICIGLIIYLLSFADQIF